MLPRLTTHELILRPVQHTDAAQVFAYASQAEVAHFTHWQQHRTLQDSQRFIQQLYTNKDQLLWLIQHKDTHHILGECGLIMHDSTTAEIHCALSATWWGKSFAQQALQALLDLGFTALDYEVIQAHIISDNIRSKRVAQKIGLMHRMTLAHHWFSNGQLYDVEFYTLTKDLYFTNKNLSQRGSLYHLW